MFFSYKICGYSKLFVELEKYTYLRLAIYYIENKCDTGQCWFDVGSVYMVNQWKFIFLLGLHFGGHFEI